jgi:nitrile hydratase accessory protein
MEPLTALLSADASPDVVSKLVFKHPWAARLFGLTLAIVEKGSFSIKEFQQAMFKSVGDYEKAGSITDDTTYYTCWINALLGLLGEKNLTSEAAITELEREIRLRLETLHDHDHDHVSKPIAVT